MLVATCRAHGASLVTKDSRLRNYPHVRTIW
jgi:PIN domain nuclease of toxin-antitoxin system